jgi:hypothetical protein
MNKPGEYLCATFAIESPMGIDLEIIIKCGRKQGQSL